MAPTWWFGRAIVWARLLVIAAWIVGAYLATAHLPSGLGNEGAELGSLLPRSSKALEVEEKSLRTFGFPLISRSMVVATKEGGFDPADGAATLRYVARTDRGKSGLKAVPFAAEGKPLEGGPIGDTMLDLHRGLVAGCVGHASPPFEDRGQFGVERRSARCRCAAHLM